MNITEMHEWFNLVSDQYNEPYFTEEEIDLFINRAINDFIFDIVYKEFSQEASENLKGFQVLDGVGSSIQSNMILSTLMVDDEPVSLNSGKVALSDLDNGFPLFLLSLKKLDGRKIKYTRDNDVSMRIDNKFLEPSLSRPFYKISGSSISIYPNTLTSCLVSYIKQPSVVSLENRIDSDLPSITHNKILAYALNLAGVASRDEAMLSISKIAGNLPKDKQ